LVVINLRRSVASPLGVLTVICVVLALVSPWTIEIPQVHADVNFGFQNPICWLVVLAMFAALLTANAALRVAAALAAEFFLLVWFAWATWAAASSQYSSVDFPFIGIDLIGPGWFEAALGLFAIGAVAARQFHDQEVRPGLEVWLLSLIPGMGLIRIGRTARGVLWAVLVSAAIFLASVDSPVAPLFQPIAGHFDLPPPPPTRAPEWILLGAGLAFAAVGLVDTFLVKRRLPQRG